MQPSEQHCVCTCPVCGGALNTPLSVAYHAETGTLVSSDYCVRFTAFEGRVFEMLWKRRSRGPVSKTALHDLLYGDDPNGGPAEKSIEVFVCTIRKKLFGANADIDIETDFIRGYQLKMNTPTRRPRAKLKAA